MYNCIIYTIFLGKTSLITRFMYDSFDNTYQVNKIFWNYQLKHLMWCGDVVTDTRYGRPSESGSDLVCGTSTGSKTAKNRRKFTKKVLKKKLKMLKNSFNFKIYLWVIFVKKISMFTLQFFLQADFLLPGSGSEIGFGSAWRLMRIQEFWSTLQRMRIHIPAHLDV